VQARRGSSSSPTAVALIVAAGSGVRLGAGAPKAFVELAGKPMLHWSVEALQAAPSVAEIVVALPEGWSAPEGATGVRGGRVRSESVRNALDAAGPAERVLVHDAARPLLTAELAELVLAALADPAVDAAVAAAPVSDTVKRAGSADGAPHPIVVETLRRSELWSVQTPQAFRREALRRALDAPEEELAAATDDASLIESSGGRVALVAWERENLKITTPLDLELAALLLGRREPD
jgi:2-C-methyl-D-erythritol 4-phosphate cytidylyltransferase